jgi:hypothetical protein
MLRVSEGGMLIGFHSYLGNKSPVERVPSIGSRHVLKDCLIWPRKIKTASLNANTLEDTSIIRKIQRKNINL